MSQVLTGVLALVVVGLIGVLVLLVVQNRDQQKQLALAQQKAAEAQKAARNTEPDSPPATADPAKPAAPPRPSQTTQPAQSSSEPPPAGDEPASPESPASEAPVAAGSTGAMESESPAESEPEPETPRDPKMHAVYAEAVKQTREAMSDRDPAAAAQALESARNNAQTSAEQAEVARLDLMLHYVNEFWKAIRNVLTGLEATQELVAGETRIAIVESDASHLIIRSAGSNRSWATEEIPTKLLLILASHGFTGDVANKAVLGAFLAVDPAGDPERARQLFQEAQQGGVDTKSLLAELEFSPGKAGGASGSRIAGGVGGKARPPADAATLEAARQEVRKHYEPDFAAAVGSAKRHELAEKLLEASPPEGASPDFQYALYDQAYELAVAAEKPVLAGEVVDKMADAFAVDPIALKLAALEKIARAARGPAVSREIATASLSLAEQAAAEKRMEDVKRILDVATQAAKDAKNAPLMRQAAAARQQLEGGNN